jgi:hypothetical protein
MTLTPYQQRLVMLAYTARLDDAFEHLAQVTAAGAGAAESIENLRTTLDVLRDIASGKGKV